MPVLVRICDPRPADRGFVILFSKLPPTESIVFHIQSLPSGGLFFCGRFDPPTPCRGLAPRARIYGEACRAARPGGCTQAPAKLAGNAIGCGGFRIWVLVRICDQECSKDFGAARPGGCTSIIILVYEPSSRTARR